MWRSNLESSRSIVFCACDVQGLKLASEEKSRYSGPWWISPLGVGLTGSAMVHRTGARPPSGGKGGASPLPCLYPRRLYLCPHSKTFGLLKLRTSRPSHPARPSASSPAPSVPMLRPYGPSHPAPGGGGSAWREAMVRRTGARAPKVRSRWKSVLRKCVSSKSFNPQQEVKHVPDTHGLKSVLPIPTKKERQDPLP